VRQRVHSVRTRSGSAIGSAAAAGR